MPWPKVDSLKKLGSLHKCLSKIVFVKNPPNHIKNLQKLDKSYVNNPSMILFNFLDFLCILEDFLQNNFRYAAISDPIFLRIHLCLKLL